MNAAGSASGLLGEASTPVGTTALYLDYHTWMLEEVELRGVGEHCEVWVGTDLNYPDPGRNDRVDITDEMEEYMIREFDSNIYPTESEYFGVPDPHDGSAPLQWFLDAVGIPALPSDGEGRTIIMIYNIVDDSYFDPSYPYYVAGFFSPTQEMIYDRNIIHIDCWDWANRTGEFSPRPFVYEGTFAHEYQHLIHADNDENEETWLNEGCSMYSELLCGYAGDPWSSINRYLASPDNSLTEWGDQGDINILSDYGGVFLFMIYLNDHFGGADFISDLAKCEENGAGSVNEVLLSSGHAIWDFDAVYQCFSLANLIHDGGVFNGLFGYTSIDFDDPGAADLNVQHYRPGSGMVSASASFGTTITYDGYDTGLSTLGAYGTDYIHIDDPWGFMRYPALRFDGDDFANVGWELTDAFSWYGNGNAWYSGASDLRDVSLVGEADLRNVSDGYLCFDTYIDIEDYWDFGFVQVSTDGGSTWTSLDNTYTTSDVDPNAHPDIIANLPGLTGWSGDWMNMMFDLSPYAGQEIMYRFRYMTDWATTYQGWAIDNVIINGVMVDDGDTVFGLEPIHPETDFMVTLYSPSLNNMWFGSMGMFLEQMTLEDGGETGLRSLHGILGQCDLWMLVTPTAGPTDYSFGIFGHMLRMR